ncbi:glycosyltransferase [Paenibacillus sp. NFR01]|uniref:glycosyltransferase family 2 protein n=1 Tax=Paenibacillus sp. NFR01 TaxID=1566279 RepID=UPI0008D6098D|nr:glycosyltransferase [Paenibacillus sp. NFR01]SEU18595.1 Glycosyl transferase family 2 [Paenibacillus sp. NFR01]
MKRKAKVSVVIPFYNCVYVDLAVESVLSQTYPQIEIVVVDDGSTRYTEKLDPYRDRIVYIRKANGGTASALNAGIRAASGTHFAWLSADDLFYPDKISRQMALLEQTGTKFCHTGYCYITGAGQRYPDPVSTPFSGKVHQIQTMMTGCPVNGSTVLMEMSVFSRVGIFNESLLYTQDYDLWLRVLPHYEWAYIPEPLLDYRIHPEMGSLQHGEAQAMEIRMVQATHFATLNQLLRKEARR